MDEALAEEIRQFRSPTDGETRMFYEIVVAPGYTPEGLAKLKGKSKTLRILEAPPRPPAGRSLRQVAGAPPPPKPSHCQGFNTVQCSDTQQAQVVGAQA